MHAYHPNYTERVRELLRNLDLRGLSGKKAREEVEKIADEIRKIVDSNPKTKFDDLNL